MKETSPVTLSPELIGRIENTEADRLVFDFLKNHNFELLINSWGILMVLYFNFYILYFRKEISPCLTDSFSFGLQKIVSAFHISCRPALRPRTLICFKIRWFMALCPSTGTSRHSPSLKSILAEWYLMAGRPHVIPQISTGCFFKNIISCCLQHRQRASPVFCSKDNGTIISTRQDFLPDRTADGDLLFTFSRLK